MPSTNYLADLVYTPKNCTTCNIPLSEYAYAAIGVDGIFCSSQCLNEAVKTKEETNS